MNFVAFSALMQIVGSPVGIKSTPVDYSPSSIVAGSSRERVGEPAFAIALPISVAIGDRPLPNERTAKIVVTRTDRSSMIIAPRLRESRRGKLATDTNVVLDQMPDQSSAAELSQTLVPVVGPLPTSDTLASSSIIQELGTPTEPTRPIPNAPTIQNDIIVTGRRGTAGDPFQKVNAKSYAVTEAVDAALIGPVATSYARVVPNPVRSGLRNFLNNLHEPDVSLNFLLQLKPGKAAETLGRFAINSTIGAAGLLDVAKRRPFNLPRRANGFADTMGYYGVKPGPFLFLPLIGATTPRDFVGLMLDRMVLPLSFGRPFNRLGYSGPTAVLNALDHRIEFDEQLKKVRDETADPYTARRRFYLEGRQAEIDELRGIRLGGAGSAIRPK